MGARAAGWLALAVGLVGAAASARAEITKVSAAFDRAEVRPDGGLSYTITVTGTDLAQPRRDPRPDFAEFDVQAGPRSGSSTQIRIVNGRTRSTETLTWSWSLFPRGTAEGERSVPGFEFAIGRDLVNVPTATVRVDVAAEPPRQDRRRGRYGGRSRWDPTDPAPAPDRDAHLVARAVVDDVDVWKGQEIVLTHLLEYDANVERFDAGVAEFPGFDKTVREVKHAGRRVDGKSWSEAPLGRWALVPLVAGEVELPPVTYTLFVQPKAPRDLFDSFFRSTVQEVRRRTQPVRLRVQALPAGAPPEFDGAVGSFRVTAELESSQLKQGDGTTLRVVVEGIGNFSSVTAPRLRLPDGLKSFDADAREEATVDDRGRTRGRKVFEYPLLVTGSGPIEIPAIEWAFFEPRAGRYVTRATRPLLLQAAPTAAAPGPAAGPRVSVVEPLEVDIHHVVTSWEPGRAGARDGMPAWFWPAVLLGPLLNLAALGWRLRGRFRERDPARRRCRDAERRARERLALATTAARAGQATETADAAARAVSRFVADRLGRAGAELSPAEVDGLVAGRVEDDLARRLRDFLADCDVLRFAPAETAAVGEARDLVRRAEGILRALGEQLRDAAPEAA